MTHRRGVATILVVALLWSAAGCAGAPTATESPAPTLAATPLITAQPTEAAAASPTLAAESPIATSSQSFWRAAGEASVGGTLAAFDGGYVITGLGRDVQVSKDGHDWQRIELPWTIVRSNGVDMDARVISLAASGSRVIAVGYGDRKPCEVILGDGGPPPCDHRPIAWVTQNGIDWVASAAADIAVDPFPYQEFQGIWPVAGGWDSALVQPLITPSYSALAHSDDGLHWTALAPVPGTATQPAPADQVGGIGSPDGRRIIWTYGEADDRVRLWRADGSSWTKLTDLGPEIGVAVGLGPSAAGEPWLIGGYSWAGPPPRLWVSTDGVDFREAALAGGSDVDAGIVSLVRWHGGYLALASDSNEVAAVWSSSDGVSWAPEPAMTDGWPYLQDIVATSSGLAALSGFGPDAEYPYPVTVLLHE